MSEQKTPTTTTELRETAKRCADEHKKIASMTYALRALIDNPESKSAEVERLKAFRDSARFASKVMSIVAAMAGEKARPLRGEGEKEAASQVATLLASAESMREAGTQALLGGIAIKKISGDGDATTNPAVRAYLDMVEIEDVGVEVIDFDKLSNTTEN